MKYSFIAILLIICPTLIWGQKTENNNTVATVAAAAGSDSIQAMLGDYERVQLPPLAVFLQSVHNHPSVRRYEANRDEEQANLKVAQSKWMDYFRLTGSYQYGRIMSLSAQSTTDDPLFYTSSGRNQHIYYVGAAFSIPVGDVLSQKYKIRAQRAKLRRIEYEYEISIEERKLKILEAYNQIISILATLKAKSDAAALYNAQMRISEQDFINGKISIIELSLERGRRSAAVVNYQEGRAELHNSITLLEMLTNVKIMNR